LNVFRLDEIRLLQRFGRFPPLPSAVEDHGHHHPCRFDAGPSVANVRVAVDALAPAHAIFLEIALPLDDAIFPQLLADG
jgi:hypothetical protein